MRMDKKELKKQYLQTQRPMGVYQVKNLANGKILIDSSLEVNGKMNRCKFQLEHGSHPNTNLQNDFIKFGADKFAFKIIDYLEPKEDAKNDYAEDLKMLEEMWIEKLQPFGDKGYNKQKIKK
jgi:hypothetical protein